MEEKISVARQESVPVSIDDDIQFVSEQLERLRELGDREEVRDIYDDEDVYDLSVRWGTALAGRLPRMAHYSSHGLLDDADERRFQSLCDELRTMSPLIERFKLARPESGGPGARRTTQRKPLFRRRGSGVRR